MVNQQKLGISLILCSVGAGFLGACPNATNPLIAGVIAIIFIFIGGGIFVFSKEN